MLIAKRRNFLYYMSTVKGLPSTKNHLSPAKVTEVKSPETEGNIQQDLRISKVGKERKNPA